MWNQRIGNGVVVAALLVAVGCSNADTDSHPEDTGRVEFALVVVPMDVQCVRLVATGTRVRQQDFNVTPGQMSVLSMNGLPVGLVTFTGEAFLGGCPAGMMTGTLTYVADPVTAPINSTGVTALTLNMRRNGRASISVDFESGDVCGPAGSQCSATTVCCAGLSCQANPMGTLSCQPQPMCSPAGASCAGAASCCAGLSCQGDAAGNLTCQQSMCAAAGSQCSATTVCCTGLSCQADAAGTLSCQPQPMCSPAGASCAGAAVCCSGLTCQADSAGTLSCQPQPMCTPVGGICSPTTICCPGLMCATTPMGLLRCL
jgi:hypothetical protein